jgi:hypothetical protein
MDKWEYKILRGLSEDELNRWGEEGYEIYQIIPPPPPLPPPNPQYSPQHERSLATVILKRRKP